jgi:hypothetical protein
MPAFSMVVPTNRFRFHIRARGLSGYYLNPARRGMGSAYRRARYVIPSAGFAGLGDLLPSFTSTAAELGGNVASYGSVAGVGDISPSGQVTGQDAQGHTLSLGTVDPSSGAVVMTPQEAANKALIDNQTILNQQFWGAPTPPPSAGPIQSPGAQKAGIVSGSWLSSSTSIGGATVPNSMLAAGGAIAALMLFAKKKGR